MKKIIGCVMLTIVVAAGARGQTVRELVAEAARAPGRARQLDETMRAQQAQQSNAERARLRERQKAEAYSVKRDQVVARGAEVVPELKEIRDNPRNEWAVRATAGICAERIERLADIESFRTRSWRDDPELKDDPTWRARGGPSGIYRVVVKRWLEAGLTNHLVQLAWKGDGEVPRYGHGWKIEAAQTLERIGHPDLIHIARDCVQAIQDPMDIEGHWFYAYLAKVKDNKSLPLMFSQWVRFRNLAQPAKVALLQQYNNTPRQCAEGADNIVDGYLKLLLPMATAADEQWIVDKLKDVTLGGVGRLLVAEYQERCHQERSKSPVPRETAPSSKEP